MRIKLPPVLRSTTLWASLVLAAAVLLSAALGGPAPALAQGAPTFGIRPAAEAAGAYFEYTLEPGATLSDTALISNHGAADVTLKLYVADAITAAGGGTAFANAGEHRTGTDAWLAPGMDQLTIAAGGAAQVPFSIAVPADARPGDYVAGVVVEAPPKAGAAGNVNAIVTERAGVAVVVRVPGAASERLTLGTFCFNQETGSRFFEIPVTNSGNVITSAKGTFKLTAQDGQHVFERPVELGSVIPSLDTVIRVHAPQDPLPGKYAAAVWLTQRNGELIESEAAVTIPERKVNGCASESSARTSGNDSGDNFNIQGFAGVGGGGSFLVAGLTLALAIVSGLLGLALLRNRRRA